MKHIRCAVVRRPLSVIGSRVTAYGTRFTCQAFLMQRSILLYLLRFDNAHQDEMVSNKARFSPSQRGWAFLLLVMITAVFLRFYQLGQVPPGLYRDEAFNGLDALGVLNGRHALFFAANNGREPAYIYLTSIFVRWLGRMPIAVRVGAAVVGTITTWFVYQIGTAWFNRQTGLLSAWLWAVTLWPVHLSRVGLRPILLPFAMALTAWLCTLAVRRQKWWLWLLAGAAYGSTFYTYLASRFTPILLILFIVYLWWQGYRDWVWPGIVWFGIGTAVFLLPWFVLFLQQPNLILGRTGQVSIFNPTINGGDVWGTFWQQTGRGLGMFFWRGDDILRHNPAGRPVFDGLMALPFLLGVGQCIRQWRKPAAMLLLLWTLIMLGPTILAEDTPHFLRAVGVLPAILLFPAIGLETVWHWSKLSALVRQTAVFLLLILSLAITMRDYMAYANNPDVALLFEAAALELGEQIRDEPMETAVYVDRWFWDEVNGKGWTAVPFITDLNRVNLYRPELGVPSPQPGKLVTIYAWPFGSLNFVPLLVQKPAVVTIDVGAQARGDLEMTSYPLYVRYHIENAKQTTLSAQFANQLLLRQAFGEIITPDQMLVTLVWESETAVSPDLLTFVHLVDPAGIVVQADAPPGGNYWQSDWWRPGIVVQEQRILQLTEPFAPETHQIQVGLYYPAANERVMVLDTAGQPIGDKWIMPVVNR